MSSLPRQLGRYVLVERIGAGGMAEVYRGASIGALGFAKQVAIKCIREPFAADVEVVNMLVDEARIASTLIHPNVVQVLDLGLDEGTHFLVMEFVAGQSLNNIVTRVVKRGTRIPYGSCVYFVEQVLRGLAHAHEQKDFSGRPMDIVHRDISPHNILIGYEGSVKLADFGIARAADRLSMTSEGVLKGKVRYLAPELAMGGVATQQSDLHAVGIVLFELLTLKRLRDAASEPEVIEQVVKQEVPSLADRGVHVPRAIEAAMLRALALRPEDRWPNARAFADELRDAMRQMPGGADTAAAQGFLASLFHDDIDVEAEGSKRLQSLVRRFAGSAKADDDPMPTDTAEGPLLDTTTDSIRVVEPETVREPTWRPRIPTAPGDDELTVDAHAVTASEMRLPVTHGHEGHDPTTMALLPEVTERNESPTRIWALASLAFLLSAGLTALVAIGIARRERVDPEPSVDPVVTVTRSVVAPVRPGGKPTLVLERDEDEAPPLPDDESPPEESDPAAAALRSRRQSEAAKGALAKAEIALREKRLHAAITLARQALEAEPAEANRLLGTAHHALGKLCEARRHYEAFILHSPAHPDVARLNQLIRKDLPDCAGGH